METPVQVGFVQDGRLASVIGHPWDTRVGGLPIYAPTDVERNLLVFACNAAACNDPARTWTPDRVRQCWRVLRTQGGPVLEVPPAPRESPAPAAIDWTLDDVGAAGAAGDDWGAAGVWDELPAVVAGDVPPGNAAQAADAPSCDAVALQTTPVVAAAPPAPPSGVEHLPAVLPLYRFPAHALVTDDEPPPAFGDGDYRGDGGGGGDASSTDSDDDDSAAAGGLAQLVGARKREGERRRAHAPAARADDPHIRRLLAEYERTEAEAEAGSGAPGGAAGDAGGDESGGSDDDGNNGGRGLQGGAAATQGSGTNRRAGGGGGSRSRATDDVDAAATAGGATDAYERVPLAVRYTLRFQERVRRLPTQCVRYAYGALPLWPVPPSSAFATATAGGGEARQRAAGGGARGAARPRGAGAPFAPPPCPGCGASRVFEAQLMPHLLAELRVDDHIAEALEATAAGEPAVVPAGGISGGGGVPGAPLLLPPSLDFGSALIFSCPTSCPGSREEALLVLGSAE